MIERIYIARSHGSIQERVASIVVVEGQGIEDDRNFGESSWPGQNLTIIEAEAIEEVAIGLGLEIDLGATRRNLVVRGVRLDGLVGRIFSIGSVVLRGVETCEPCATLADHLGLDAKMVLRAFRGRGGLRCDCLSGGEIREGQELSQPVGLTDCVSVIPVTGRSEGARLRK